MVLVPVMQIANLPRSEEGNLDQMCLQMVNKVPLPQEAKDQTHLQVGEKFTAPMERDKRPRSGEGKWEQRSLQVGDKVPLSRKSGGLPRVVEGELEQIYL